MLEMENRNFFLYVWGRYREGAESMGDIKKKRIIQKHQRPDTAVNDPISEVLKRAERKQYLVEGARLMCTNGGSTAELKIPEGHGYYSGGRKKANCKDCAAVENIPCFGR